MEVRAPDAVDHAQTAICGPADVDPGQQIRGDRVRAALSEPKTTEADQGIVEEHRQQGPAWRGRKRHSYFGQHVTEGGKPFI